MNAATVTPTAPLPAVRDELAEAAELRNKQTNAARERRLQKLARRSPEIEELYGEHQATLVAHLELRKQHETVKGSLNELGTEASRLQEENISLRMRLDESVAIRETLLKDAEANDVEIERLRAELAETKEKLVAALKPKKAS